MSELPSDLDAERYLLGAVMLRPSLLTESCSQLATADFFLPSHGVLFDLIVDLWATGDLNGGDAQSVTLELKRRRLEQPTQADVIGLISQPYGGPASARAAADTILRLSIARRVAMVGRQITELGLDATASPAEMVDQAKELIGSVRAPVGDKPVGLARVEDFLDSAVSDPSPWVIPAMLRRSWRCIIVGGEGAGKMVVMRQLCAAIAQGIHPFTNAKVTPMRSLLLDAENPQDAIVETMGPATDAARNAAGLDYDPDRSWIWHRSGGINLCDRSDRLHFEAVLQQTRPDLVCAGPLYKLFHAKNGENDESAAAAIQVVLDDLRTRYGFALVLEHHAPHGGAQGREMRPFGSSLWMRWPEIGCSLHKKPEGAPKGSLRISRFRPDRVVCTWPTRLDRGRSGLGEWPWAAVYGVEDES